MSPAATEEVTGGDVDPQLLGELCAVGVAPAVARSLVAVHGVEVCRKQVQALPLRKAKDKAALLVAAIAGRWTIPATRNEQAEKQQKQAAQARQKAAQAILEQDRAKRAAQDTARLAGLSTGQREALEARAVALYRQEQPGAAAVMLGKRCGAVVVQGYMLRLLDAGGGGEPVST